MDDKKLLCNIGLFVGVACVGIGLLYPFDLQTIRTVGNPDVLFRYILVMVGAILFWESNKRDKLANTKNGERDARRILPSLGGS